MAAANNFAFKVGFSEETAKFNYGNKKLLIFDDGSSLTYNQVNEKSAKLANCLKNDYNVKKGDRILCRTSKNNSVFLYLAVLRVGGVYVPLNPQYTENETRHFLETVEPTVFVTCNVAGDTVFHNLVKGGANGIIDELEIATKSEKFTDLFDVEAVEDKDLAVILFTSGTTGKSKGACTSHGTLWRNAKVLSETWEFTSDDVLLHSLPFYHVHGMLVAFHCTLFSKSSTVFLEKFTVPEIIKWMPKCTVFMGVPTFYSRLLRSADFTKETVTNIRLFKCASAPLTAQLFEEFRQRTGGRTILQRYGMTEANAITTSPIDENKRTHENVGQPFPGIELRISDSGAILVRSQTLFTGYWKEPEKTQKEFSDDGFFNTGDAGYIDKNYCLVLNGRQKDMIISGGLNVYPMEIEELIDGTGDVHESAIIGVPHSDFGEAVAAVCVRKTAGDSSQDDNLTSKFQTLAKKHLAPYKRPKKYIFVDELPRNFLGKIQKNVLRETNKNLFIE